MKSPDNKYVLIPDPETAGIIRRIFQMAASGNAPYTIAKTLSTEQVLVPSAYNKQKSNYGFKEKYTIDTDWSPGSEVILKKSATNAEK
jgi:DNA invertase Pin-like site-specific DNA recombinase